MIYSYGKMFAMARWAECICASMHHKQPHYQHLFIFDSLLERCNRKILVIHATHWLCATFFFIFHYNWIEWIIRHQSVHQTCCGEFRMQSQAIVFNSRRTCLMRYTHWALTINNFQLIVCNFLGFKMICSTKLIVLQRIQGKWISNNRCNT